MTKGNVRKFIVFVLLISVTVGLCACSITSPKPEEGIWYCEELRLEIDFSAYNQLNTAECGKIRNPDGTTQNVSCHFDYGCGITVSYRKNSLAPEDSYFIGKFQYKKATWFREESFTVTANDDNRTYVFERIG